MLIVTSYIIRLLAPLVNSLGLIGFIAYGMYALDSHLYSEDPLSHVPDLPVEILGTIGYANGWMFLAISIVIFILGLWYGIKAYKNDIPVRWLWSKSKNSLFDFALTTIVGYGFCFAAYPYALFLIHFMVVYYQATQSGL